MTSQITYKTATIEYLKSSKDKIVTVLSFKYSGEDFFPCLRRLELLASRARMKEIWLPLSITLSIDSSIEGKGYKRCILGYHEENSQVLEGYKKIL